MAVSREWVGQVRAAVADLQRGRDLSPSLESEAWRAFDANTQLLAPPGLEQTPRARQIRAINRIAMTHGWQCAIAHFLDTRGAAYMSELTDPQLDDLHDRMHGYVEAAMSGCDPDDVFPAR